VYELHTCTDYSDAANTVYHSVGDFDSAYSTAQMTGQGVGDQHGTESSTDAHNGAAVCDPSYSIRVYHKNGSPAVGHHCKIADGSGTCTCRCNSLFKGNYNPRDTDLFDHTIVSTQTLSFAPVNEAPTKQPTSWPTKAPTLSPTAYPTKAEPTASEVAVQTSEATTEVTLEGITAAEFTTEVEEAVEEAIAAQYGVHVSQVTVEVVTSTSRRLTTGLNLKVTIQASEAKVVEVQTEMQQIADVPASQETFAGVINEFLKAAETAIVITVEACTPPVVEHATTSAPASNTWQAIPGGMNTAGKCTTCESTFDAPVTTNAVRIFNDKTTSGTRVFTVTEVACTDADGNAITVAGAVTNDWPGKATRAVLRLFFLLPFRGC
jgi:hypothetical protein